MELFAESGGKGLNTVAIDVYLSPANCDTPPDLAGLYELSVDAYYAAVHAEMSELPIKEEISRYVEKVCKAGGIIAGGKSANITAGSKAGSKADNSADNRAAAGRAAFDRGDTDVLTVLKTAGKVQHEIHRITGFLRFSPGTDGVYTARCSPDYFILPALTEHFTLRFGETPWAIIDEKRKLCLCRKAGGRVMLTGAEEAGDALPSLTEEKERKDFWEGLWRLYHRSVNIENRKNPRLQRQFMPERYQKYLPEMQKTSPSG